MKKRKQAKDVSLKTFFKEDEVKDIRDITIIFKIKCKKCKKVIEIIAPYIGDNKIKHICECKQILTYVVLVDGDSKKFNVVVHTK